MFFFGVATERFNVIYDASKAIYIKYVAGLATFRMTPDGHVLFNTKYIIILFSAKSLIYFVKVFVTELYDNNNIMRLIIIVYGI